MRSHRSRDSGISQSSSVRCQLLQAELERVRAEAAETRRLLEESRAASIGAVHSEPDAEDTHTSVITRTEEAASAAAALGASLTPPCGLTEMLKEVLPAQDHSF